MNPAGGDRWIIDTGQAVKYATEHDYTLLTSVGMSSWEITLFFASKYKVRQQIFIPAESDDDFVTACNHYEKEFRLTGKPVEWRPVRISRLSGKSNNDFRSKRDRLIMTEADIIFPVSIRPDGNLAGLINDRKKPGGHIDNRFGCDYERYKRDCKAGLNQNPVGPAIDNTLSDYVIHWTRSCHAPWPGESLYDYYDSLTTTINEYSHSALRTLLRILGEKKLRASSRHMRKGIRAVSFSALPPTQALRLMKWRARYREMTFEPYGIAIKRKPALKMGIRKVLYGNPEMYEYLDETDKPYFQSVGTKGNWMPEREYRHIGDIDPGRIFPYSMAVIVSKSEGIDMVRRHFDGPVFSIR